MKSKLKSQNKNEKSYYQTKHLQKSQIISCLPNYNTGDGFSNSHIPAKTKILPVQKPIYSFKPRKNLNFESKGYLSKTGPPLLPQGPVLTINVCQECLWFSKFEIHFALSFGNSGSIPKLTTRQHGREAAFYIICHLKFWLVSISIRK